MLWGLLWRSENRLDGRTERLLHRACLPLVFRARREARDYAREHYGYILDREDLRAEPHGWKMPKPVRVVIEQKGEK